MQAMQKWPTTLKYLSLTVITEETSFHVLLNTSFLCDNKLEGFLGDGPCAAVSKQRRHIWTLSGYHDNRHTTTTSFPTESDFM